MTRTVAKDSLHVFGECFRGVVLIIAVGGRIVRRRIARVVPHQAEQPVALVLHLG